MIERALARLFPRSFTARLMSVAFIGIHVPLILLAVWMISTSQLGTGAIVRLLLVVLGATLLGTGITIAVLYRMLAPLRAAASALDDYYANRELPRLPDTGEDEIGRLLKGINRSIHGLDKGLRMVQEQARMDPLTGALNRRGCQQALAQSLETLAQSPGPFMLFVVDVDNLKQINDCFGHAAGDAALVRLAGSAREWLGQHDWLGRWGGDEFMVGVHADELIVADRVRQWMAGMAQTPVRDIEDAIHVSAGAAVWQEGQSGDALYRSADAAMYQAKFSGGGKLVVARKEDDDARGGD